MGWLVIPTDNIYKFCAIGGLMLIFLPMTGLVYFLSYTDELTEASGLAMARTRIEMDFADTDIKALSELRLTIMRGLLHKTLIPEDIPSFLSVESLSKRIDDQTAQHKTTSLNLAEAEATLAKAVRFVSYSKSATYFSFLLVFIGGQLAVYGFKNWYGKTQLLVDKKQ